MSEEEAMAAAMADKVDEEIAASPMKAKAPEAAPAPATEEAVSEADAMVRGGGSNATAMVSGRNRLECRSPLRCCSLSLLL